jgi:hypothetical protein
LIINNESEGFNQLNRGEIGAGYISGVSTVSGNGTGKGVRRIC